MTYQQLKGFRIRIRIRIAVIISVFLEVSLLCGSSVFETEENEILNTNILTTEPPPPPPPQQFLATPQNQTVSVGSFAKLLCIVSNKRGTLQWAKDFKGLAGLGLGNGSSHPNYAIIGDKQIGEYSLLIRKVTIQDEGVYSCEVSPGTGTGTGTGTAEEDFGLFSYVYLTVEAAPSSPIITLEGYPGTGTGTGTGPVHAFDSQLIILKCVSLYGRPPPEVTWLDPKGRTGPDAAVETMHLRRYSNSTGEHVNVDASNNVRATISFYTVKVFKADNDKNISCQIRSRSRMTVQKLAPAPMPMPLSTFIQLNISFPPQITLRLEITSPQEPTHYLYHSWTEPGVRIREMDLVKIVCRGSANPPAEFRWFINDERVEKKYDIVTVTVTSVEDVQLQVSTFFLHNHNVTRSLHNSTVKCEAQNWIGSIAASKSLYIKVGFQVPVKPETTTATPLPRAIKLSIGIGIPAAVIIVIIASVAICMYLRPRYSRVHSNQFQVPLHEMLQGPIDLGSSLRSDVSLTREPKPEVEAAAAAPVPQLN